VIGRYNIRSRRAIEKIGAVLLEGHPASGPDRVVYGIDGAAGQGIVRNLNRAQ
jgi:hypothetical protein